MLPKVYNIAACDAQNNSIHHRTKKSNPSNEHIELNCPALHDLQFYTTTVPTALGNRIDESSVTPGPKVLKSRSHSRVNTKSSS